MKKDVKRFGNSAIAIVLSAVMLLSTMVIAPGTVTWNTANALTVEENSVAQTAETVSEKEENTVTVDIEPEDIQSSVLDADEIKQAEPEAEESAVEEPEAEAPTADANVKAAAPAKVLPKASGSFSSGSTIYFLDELGWGSVAVHPFTGSNGIDAAMTNITGTNIYYYTFSSTYDNMIFHKNSGNNQWSKTNATEQFTSGSNTVFYCNGSASTSTLGDSKGRRAVSSCSFRDLGFDESTITNITTNHTFSSATKTIYFSPIAYYWNNYYVHNWYEVEVGNDTVKIDGFSSWPGVEMTATTGKSCMYQATVSKYANRFIFTRNNNGSEKYRTGTISLDDDENNVFVPLNNNYWGNGVEDKSTEGYWITLSDYEASLTTQKTVYVDTSNNWKVNTAAAFCGKPDGTWVSAPVQMTASDNSYISYITVDAGYDRIIFTKNTSWGSGNEDKTYALSLIGHENEMCFTVTDTVSNNLWNEDHSENKTACRKGYWGLPAQYWPDMEDLTGAATDTSCYMYWGNSDDSFVSSGNSTYNLDANNKVIKQQNDTSGNTWYYADFTPEEMGSNCFFGVANRSGEPLNNVKDDLVVSLSNSFVLGKGLQEKNGFNFGKTWTLKRIKTVRIYVNSLNKSNEDNPFYRYSVVVASQVTEGSVNVIAKDGTLRGDFKKFADLGDTTIYAINGVSERSGVSDSKFNIGSTTIYHDYKNGDYYYAETAEIDKGTTITIRTTIDDKTDDNSENLRKKYYVKAFNINGETVWPTTTGVHSDGIYDCEYTIPTTMTTDQLEITPIYFYNENTDETNSREYITFIVENFVGDVVTEWGKKVNGKSGTPILACYAWYGSGNDQERAKATNKPALGGYPGQPMVYENGHYIMQVPTTVDDNSHIQGITLNNYVWDFVHCDTQGARSNTQREGINCQTYDYDDFVVLSCADPAPDFIAFRFKYETTKGAKSGLQTTNPTTDDPQSWGNQPSTASFNANDYTNGWEDYDDYYGNTIDVFNNILKKNDGTVVSTNYNTNYTSSYFHIVSSGYRDIYYGHFATLWYIYDNNGNYVGKLPSSALYYQPASGTSMPASYSAAVGDGTISAVPSWFLPFYDGTTYNETANRAKTNEQQKIEYWITYCKLYYGYESSPSALDHPADITYETAIRAQDIDSASGGTDEAHKHPRDPGLRNDGNWYYSKSGETFNAEIVIKYSTLADPTNFSGTDTFVTTDGAEKPYAGSTTGAHAYFTTKSYLPTGYSTPIAANFYQNYQATNVYSSKDNFTVAANQTSISPDGKTTYAFKGWFIEYDGVESPLDYKEDADKVIASAADMRGYVKLVAKYAPVATNTNTNFLTITHDLYANATKFANSPAVLGGDATPSISVQVIDTTNGNAVATDLKVYELNDKTVKIYESELSKYRDSKYSLKVVLNVASDDKTNYNTTYLKTVPESTLEGAAGVNGYSAYSSTAVSGPGDAGLWTGTKTTTKTSSAAGTDTVTYTATVASLFNNTTLKSNVIKFYSQVNSSRITVEFKYYDRDMSTATQSKATNISTEATSFTKIENIVDATEVENPKQAQLDTTIQNAINYVNEKKLVENVIDEYVFYKSQETAEGALKLLKIPGTDTLYTATKYHTDYYSRQSNNNNYFKEDPNAKKDEKWVTYYDADSNEVEKTTGNSDFTDEQFNRICKVVVWAYNKPQVYTMNFQAFGDLIESETGSGLYLAQNATNGNDSSAADYVNYGAMQFYYNERVGVLSDNDLIDGVSPHLAEYNIAQRPNAIKVQAPNVTNYVFDGWYEQINNTYVKVSSDQTFGNRVTKSAILTAGYKMAESAPENEIKGVTVTKNEPESYIDSKGVHRVRYVTQLNAYGCDDSDPNFTSVSVVYIKLPADMDASTGSILVSNLFNDADFKAGIIGELNKNRATDSKRSATTALVVDIDSTNAVNDRTTVVYTYDIRPTYTDGTENPDPTGNQIVFTNKNRGQFVLDLTQALVEAGKPSSNMMVITPVKYEDENVKYSVWKTAYETEHENQTAPAADSTEFTMYITNYLSTHYGNAFATDTDNGYVYLVSDNYVVYDNNTHTTTGGEG